MNFSQTLQEVRNGQLVGRLTDELDEVVAAVAEHGKAGTLTLKLTVKPNGDEAVTIEPNVTSSKPKGKLGSAIFFRGKDGLSRQSPSQMDIEDELAKKRAERNEEVG